MKIRVCQKFCVNAIEHLTLHKKAEGGKRTNRFSRYSRCVLLGSSFLWLSIRYSCVSWVCFGVATFVATCVFMDVLVVSLLHGLICALLHEYLVFKAHCSSGLFCWRTSGLSTD